LEVEKNAIRVRKSESVYYDGRNHGSKKSVTIKRRKALTQSYFYSVDARF
jgi:hypothetical protein